MSGAETDTATVEEFIRYSGARTSKHDAKAALSRLSGRVTELEQENARLLRQRTDLQNSIGNYVVSTDELCRQRGEAWAHVEAMVGAIASHPVREGKPWRYEADPMMAAWYERLRAALAGSAGQEQA
jgi:hypothetical protein